MKILLLTPFYRPDNYGGAVKVYESLCKNQDFEAHIICPISKKEFDDKANFEDTNTKIQFSFSSDRVLSRVREYINYRSSVKNQVLNEIKLIKPDLIINGGVRWFGWLNSEFMKLAPVMNYIHGEELSIKPVGLFGKWLLKTQNKTFSEVALNLCVSSYTSNELKRLSPAAKVSVLTNFVDIDSFYPINNKSDLKEKYELEGKASLICVCRLIERKGVADLLAALKVILHSSLSNDVILNVCGSGPELNSLIALSKSLGISDKVNFRGFTDEDVMLELLQASDIFVMPNKTVNGDLEGFGLVFLEANACRLPVIGGRSGGVVDAIEDDFSGYLINPGVISDIAEKLNYLIENKNEMNRIGDAGYERAKEHFTLKSKRLEFSSVLKRLINGDQIE